MTPEREETIENVRESPTQDRLKPHNIFLFKTLLLFERKAIEPISQAAVDL